MADVFISYAREDGRVAHDLAALLERAGFSVWWDPELRAGAAFAEEIERELERASIVLVLWSGHSIRSKWVADEAEFAARNGKLLPALLEAVEPPLGFRQYQALAMGDPREPAVFARLVESIEQFRPELRHRGAAARHGVPGAVRLRALLRRASRQFGRRAKFLAGPAALGAAAAAAILAYSEMQRRNLDAEAATLTDRLVEGFDNPGPAQVDAVGAAMRGLVRGADQGPALELLKEGKVGDALAEIEERSERLAAAGAPASERVEALKLIGAIAFYSDTQKAIAAYRAAYDLAPKDPVVLGQLGDLHLQVNDPEVAYAFFVALDETAAALPHGDRRRYALAAKIGVGRAFLYLHRWSDAEAILLEARAQAQAMNARMEEAIILEKLGAAKFSAGDLAPAYQYQSQALVIARATGDLHSEGRALQILGKIAKERGDPAAAEAHYVKAGEVFASIGDRKNEAINRLNLGELAVMRNDDAAAAAYFEESTRIARAGGYWSVLGFAHEAWAQSLRRNGDAAGGCAQLRLALAAFRGAPFPEPGSVSRLEQAIGAACAAGGP